MATVTKNRTYGKIDGFWVITQKQLIISEILHVLKMNSTARSTYPAIFKILILMVIYFKNYKRYMLSLNCTNVQHVKIYLPTLQF
jgi:hypothetical protein